MSEPSRDEDDLADRVAELEESLSALREELREPPQGPPGLPRPPTHRELLRFTERHAIPTAIAVLEANVRALRLLQGALRMTDPERAGEGASATSDRAERAGRAVLDRLDGALADLQAELAEGDVPRDGEARDVLRDARQLSAEIRDRLEGDGAVDDSGRPAGDGTRADDPAGAAPAEDGETADDGDGRVDDEDAARTAVRIDVEDELRSIKDELDAGDGSGDDGERSGDDGEQSEGDGERSGDGGRPEDGRRSDDGRERADRDGGRTHDGGADADSTDRPDGDGGETGDPRGLDDETRSRTDRDDHD